MTVVARLIIDNCPLLIGDLLLSNKLPGRDVLLPTTHNILRATSNGDVPWDLCQKIVLIGDHIAVGWAGALNAAQDLIGELNLRVTTEHLDMRALNECFDRQRSTLWDDLALVGFVREPGVNIAAFSRFARSATSPVLGNVRFAGTGTDALAKYIEENSAIPTHDTVELNAANRAVLYGFTLSGGLLNVEIHTGENLIDLFGGGYELATISEGKFVKVGDATCVYWRARYVSDDEIYLTDTPKRVFRYAYDGDLLVIRAWEPISPVSFTQSIYPVRPVYRSLTPEEKENPPVLDMNAIWLCNYVVVEADGKRPWIATSMTHHPNVTSSIHFFDHQGESVFSVEPAFLQSVRKLIKESPALKA
jgi:hypothetical protein